MEKSNIFEKIKSVFNNLYTRVKENPWEYIIFFLIIFIGAFLRLYRIDEYMTFLGDEGRDAIIVRRLLVHTDPILIGPGTSIGNMYLGPLYYYMMAPALYLAKYSPVGPAVQIALLGIITLFLVWKITKEWFGVKAALVASFLYAISPTVIIYSKSSWNPNIMPFFALVFIYSLWKVWKKEDFKWLFILSVSFAFALQSHYLALLLLPTFLLFYILTYYKIKLRGEDLENTQKFVEKKVKAINFFKYSIISFLVFSFLMSPIVIFDARHNWRNFLSMKKFFLERQTTVSAKPWNAFPKIPEIAAKISARLITGRNENLGKWILAILSIPSLFLVMNRKRMEKNEQSAYTVVIVWILFALIGLGLYKQEIYDHYYGFFFPAPFMLLGAFVGGILDNLNVLGKTIVWGFIALIVFFNVLENPFKYPPNRQVQRSIEVAEKISQEHRDRAFNLAVIAERNYEDGYQYFLEKSGLPVVDIDSLRADETIKDQLFVVCELPPPPPPLY